MSRKKATPADILKKFWSKVQKGNPNDCWEWQGRLDNDGYGIIDALRKDGKYSPHFAHRYIFQELYGELDYKNKNECVCHTCDNPKCVNPNHLWKGTHLDNMHDLRKKGRARNQYM